MVPIVIGLRLRSEEVWVEGINDNGEQINYMILNDDTYNSDIMYEMKTLAKEIIPIYEERDRYIAAEEAKKRAKRAEAARLVAEKRRKKKEEEKRKQLEHEREMKRKIRAEEQEYVHFSAQCMLYLLDVYRNLFITFNHDYRHRLEESCMILGYYGMVTNTTVSVRFEDFVDFLSDSYTNIYGTTSKYDRNRQKVLIQRLGNTLTLKAESDNGLLKIRFLTIPKSNLEYILHELMKRQKEGVENNGSINNVSGSISGNNNRWWCGTRYSNDDMVSSI